MDREVLDEIDIRQFKMMNGNDIIAHVQETDENGYWLESPLEVIISPAKPESFFLASWVGFMADPKVLYIEHSRVITSVQCHNAMKDHYIKTAIDMNKLERDVLDTLDDMDDPMDFSDTDLPKSIH